MASDPQTQESSPAAEGPLRSLFRFLGSLKVAVGLLIVVAVVCTVTTFVESRLGGEVGTPVVQWYVYDHPWFACLLGLLALNIIAAMLIRFPWKMRHLGLLVTHAGVLVLLAGSLLTLRNGIEGRLAFAEGEQEDTITITDRCQLTISSQGEDGMESMEFSFAPGPVNWREGKVLDFGETDGLGVRVLRFYPHAERIVQWVADDSDGGDSAGGGPAAKISLQGPGGQELGEEWLSAGPYGGQAFIGAVRFGLLPVSNASMLKDFFEPPPFDDESSADGVLSMHYQNKMYRVPVRENLGKRVPVGDSKIEVEIVEYLPNAKGGSGGQFTGSGDQPKNPVVQLMVHVPGEPNPMPEIAQARSPLLSLDGVYRRVCPVRFWYHHAAVSPQVGAELLQTPDGKLHCRVSPGDQADGQSYLSRGEVEAGDRIEMEAGFQLSLIEYIPHAQREVAFGPTKSEGKEPPVGEAAALIELSAGGASQDVWLMRNDPQFGFKWVETADGPRRLEFAYEQLPLGFSLKLHDFTREMNPGRIGNASFASEVQLIDEAQGIDQRHRISMNNPLTYGKFSFYQSSYSQMPDGREASILSAAYDPGRFLKYLGSIVLCVGMAMMFYLTPFLRRRGSRKADDSRTVSDS